MFDFVHALFNEFGAIFDRISNFVLDSPILTLFVFLFPILFFISWCETLDSMFSKKDDSDGETTSDDE